jgi:hypothetical protein
MKYNRQKRKYNAKNRFTKAPCMMSYCLNRGRISDWKHFENSDVD